MGTLLRLRGLPFSATAEDVQNFFSGTFEGPVGVYLGTKSGKRDGSAYVAFPTQEDAAKALQQRQHEHMGNRYIEIFVAAEADLVAATTGQEASLDGHVVRLRGLPFNSTAQDVLTFFEGVVTLGGEAGVVFTCTPDGRPTGEAYVGLADEEAQAAALGRHKEKIGARYIEIFESSRGDMYQAVQQHGFFTTVGGRRRHHWHQQHGGGGAAAAGQGYPQDAGSGGRGGQVDELTGAFAGFGLSQRDMQVPGPPRWGAYGAPADQQYQQYGGPQRQMQQAGVLPAGAMRGWPPGRQMPGGMQHFNPAPGPPPGKSSRSGLSNGARQSGSGMMGSMHHEYAAAAGGHGHGHGQAVMFSPFMMQHPLMMQHQQQHHASPWGTAGMMQHQQGGGWYGGMQMGRAGMQMGHAGMGTAYSFSPAFFPMRGGGGGGMGQMGSTGHHSQQYGSGGGRQQSHSAASSSSHAAPASQQTRLQSAVPATSPANAASSSQQPPEQAAAPAVAPDAPGSSEAEERPESAAAEAAPAAAAPPATPEQ